MLWQCVRAEVIHEASRRTRREMSNYEGNDAWEDVIPIPQDDGENALAAISYTDEYAEGKSPSRSSTLSLIPSKQWATCAP